MSNVYTFEGRTTNEAIEKGLKELKISKKDADIKVLESEEKRSFFSILTPRVVKVEITLKETIKKDVPRKKVMKIEEKDMETAKNNLEHFIKVFLISIMTPQISIILS